MPTGDPKEKRRSKCLVLLATGSVTGRLLGLFGGVTGRLISGYRTFSLGTYLLLRFVFDVCLVHEEVCALKKE